MSGSASPRIPALGGNTVDDLDRIRLPVGRPGSRTTQKPGCACLVLLVPGPQRPGLRSVTSVIGEMLVLGDGRSPRWDVAFRRPLAVQWNGGEPAHQRRCWVLLAASKSFERAAYAGVRWRGTIGPRGGHT